jgi:hypothetical protein
VFKLLDRGEPVLFRLKSPDNATAGVGFFVHSSILPVSLGWAAFSAKYGGESETVMRQRGREVPASLRQADGPRG